MSLESGLAALSGHHSPRYAETDSDVAEERAPSVDEYDEMEKWFSSSFPTRLPAVDSTGSEQRSSPVDRNPPPPLRGSKIASSRLDNESDHESHEASRVVVDMDEYSIEVDPSGLSDSDGERSIVLCIDGSAGDGEVDCTGSWTPESKQTELADGVRVKVFKRRLQGDADSSSCCSRCKSNLNGKLIVRCVSCPFRRHLYCFTPPLKQHPAFQQQQHVTAQGKRVKVRPTAEYLARWNCDECQQKLVANQAPDGSWELRRYKPTTCSSSERATRVNVSNGKRAAHHKAMAERQRSPPQHERTADLQPSGEMALAAVQDRWRGDGTSEFDWYAFRAEKAKKLISQREMDSPDELIYYSKPFADLKATATSWMARVVEQKKFRRQRDRMESKTQLPRKRNVMCTLTEAELVLIERTLLRRQRESEDEMALLDDTLVYQFDISLSRIRYFRQPRPSIAAPLASDNEDDDDTSAAIALLLAEIASTVALSAEDVPWRDSMLSENPEASAVETREAKLTWAAITVQSAFIRWSYEARQRVNRSLQLDLLHRQLALRQSAARGSIRRLRSCVLFIVVLMRKLRKAQLKRQLLFAMQEASEDAKVVSAIADDAERTKKLAEKRIQRFFLHRVRRYIRLKRQVMSRRILRWWKRKYVGWRWRESALAVRERRREQASRTIQRAYQRFRVKKAFKEIFEKLALRKVKQFLRSWLMARVVRKERARVEIYTLAVGVKPVRDTLICRPDASVNRILQTLGMALFEAGDFWNAACVLARSCKLNQAAVSAECRLALAYSHHMTWYSSYGAYNLAQAYESYCVALSEVFQHTSTCDALLEIDPIVLQDTAVVMMHLENFSGSLRILARLIEFFPQHEAFPLWLLLAAVQLQQRGEWAQSLEYLTYLQDIPPSPYLERDILSLCAIGLERQKHEPGNRRASREAWNAAIRQWSLSQKEIHVLEMRKDEVWSQPRSGGSGGDRSRTSQSTLRKWEMLNEFAQRAVAQGHYLIACRLMLYMLELHPADEPECSDSERSQRASVWWNLADVFRHLGHLDLYVNATIRSHLCVEPGDALGDEQVAEWTSEAEKQAQSFERDVIALSTVDLVRKIHAQYAQQ